MVDFFEPATKIPRLLHEQSCSKASPICPKNRNLGNPGYMPAKYLASLFLCSLAMQSRDGNYKQTGWEQQPGSSRARKRKLYKDLPITCATFENRSQIVQMIIAWHNNREPCWLWLHDLSCLSRIITKPSTSTALRFHQTLHSFSAFRN